MELRSTYSLTRREIWVIIASFVLLSVCIYGWTLPHTFVTLNDELLVYQNSIVQQISPATIASAFTHYDPELYIPLTFLSYQLDWWLGNGTAFIFHLDNLFLHTIDALLACWLFTLLSRNKWIGIVCGLIFLVHPINTETVEWISSRKDLLSTLLGRMTLIAYLYYLSKKRIGFFYGSVSFFLFALLAKIKVVTLPFVLLLVDWKEGRPLNRHIFIEKIPFFFLSIVFSVIAFYGKTTVLDSSSWTTKIFLGVNSAAFYIQHFFIPYNFSIYYPYLSNISFLSPNFIISCSFLLVFCAGAIWSLRWTKEIFFGCAVYLIGISASIFNLAKGDLYIGSDRYVYTALIGITYALASVVFVIWEHNRARFGRSLTWSIWIGMTALILFLATLSFRQSYVWADSVSLFRYTISVNPEYYRPYYDLGVAFDAEENTESAIAAYKQSLSLFDFSLSHVNLGSDYYRQGERTLARQQFLLALQNDPHLAMADFDLGVMDGEEGKYDEAKKHYQSAIAGDPSLIDARLNLSKMEADAGDTQDALEQLNEAIALDPKNPRTLSLVRLFLDRKILHEQ